MPTRYCNGYTRDLRAHVFNDFATCPATGELLPMGGYADLPPGTPCFTDHAIGKDGTFYSPMPIVKALVSFFALERGSQDILVRAEHVVRCEEFVWSERLRAELEEFVHATRQMESARARVDCELELMAQGSTCTALHTAQACRLTAETEREELAESLKSQGVPADLLNLL